jgi:hypothetical protein
MSGADLFGYVASILVFGTFYMKRMMPLRVTAIASNLAFISYAWAYGLTPILLLHGALLPLNILRLVELRALTAKDGLGRDPRAAPRANRLGTPSSAQEPHRSAVGLGCWVAMTCIGLGAFCCPSAHAQEPNDTALAFLKLHRVPCLAVVKVGTVVLDEVVTCEDGREWMLFWLENEVAFVNPETREPYKWRWELNALYPQLYDASRRVGGGPNRKFVRRATMDYSATADPP